MKNIRQLPCIYFEIMILCGVLCWSNLVAQTIIDPPYNVSHFNGLSLSSFNRYDWRDSLDFLFSPININFGDTTVFNLTQTKIALGFQWGSYGRGQKRLGENYVQFTGSYGDWWDGTNGNLLLDTNFIHNIHNEALLARAVRNEKGSVNFVLDNIYLNAYWILRSPSLEWRPCAPIWRNINDAFDPILGDTLGCVLGFQNKPLGESRVVAGQANFMRYILRVDSIVGGITRMAFSKPVFNFGGIRMNDFYMKKGLTSSDTSGGTYEHNRNVAKNFFNADANGTKWYLSITLKRLNNDSTQSDTNRILSLRMKCWFRHDFDSSGTTVTRVDTSVVHFDSLFAFQSSADTIRASRGVTHARLATPSSLSTIDSLFTIRRRDLPQYSGTDNSDFITASAFFRTANVSEPDPNVQAPNMPFGKYRSSDAFEKDQIDSFDIQVVYHGNCSVVVSQIDLVTPIAREVLFGKQDTLISALISRDVIRIDTIKSLLHANVKIGSWYGVDEADVPLWRLHRYVSKLLDKHLTTEAPHQDAYRQLVPQSSYWSGRSFNVLSRHIAPYITRTLWASELTWGNSTPKQLDINGGWLSAGWNNATNYECFECKKGSTEYYRKWGFPNQDTLSRLPNPTLSDNTAYALCGIEGILANYWTNKTLLFSEAPWWVNNWCEVRWRYGAKFAKPDSSVVLSYIHSVERTRPHTGEEMRRMAWLPIVLGAKGLMYDGDGQDDYVPLDTMRFFKRGGDTDCTIIRESSFVTKYRHFQDAGLWYRGATSDTWLNDSLGTKFILADSNGHDYFTVVPAREKFALPEYILRDTAASTCVWKHIGTDSNRIYLGYRSMRYEMMKVHDDLLAMSETLMHLRLMAWSGKGFNWLRACRDNDTSYYHKFVNLGWGNVTCRTMSDTTTNEQWDTTHTFVDVTVHKLNTVSPDSVFFIGVLNRHTNPLVEIAPSEPDSSRYKFFSTFEFDSLVDAHVFTKYCQLGARQITIPCSYTPPFYDKQGRLLHIQEIVADTSTPHLDTIMCANCSFSSNYLPGEGKLFRVTVLRPKNDSIYTGSLEYSNQRKIIAMPVLIGRDLTTHQGIYDSSQVRYHVVFHRDETFHVLPHDTIVPRVYYKRSKIINRCTPQDVVPNLSDTAAWDMTVCISDSIREYPTGCSADTLLPQWQHCKYPALVVRYDSATDNEYVYVVFTCKDETAPAPTPAIMVESVFRSDTVLSPKSKVVERFPVGSYGMDFYPHGMINASKAHNYYAWSSYQDGISVWSRHPDSRDSMRCPGSSNWHHSTVSWFPNRGLGSIGADCEHPSLNTYSRLDMEDVCALVWEESTNDTTKSDRESNIYYTHLADTSGALVHMLPMSKSGIFPHYAPSDTNSDGKIFRVSKVKDRHYGFHQHHLASVARDLAIGDPTWRADIVLWTGTGDSLGICSPSLTTVHGIFPARIWNDRDTMNAQESNSIWSCQIGLNHPSLTWATSFSHDSDVVFDFDCPADSVFYYSDMIFNFSKHYWYFSSPENEMSGGSLPHLSAQPFLAGNVQWKQMRRIFNKANGSANPSIFSTVQGGLFKSGEADRPYAVYPLVGFQNDDGLFTLCDMIDDEHTYTMHALFHGVQQQFPSDTIYSDWFRVNDKKPLHFAMNGNYTDIAMMFVQNRRTGYNTYVDLDQIDIDTSNAMRLGTYDVQNGGGDEYRVLLAKRDTTARYAENVYIDYRPSYFGKSVERKATSYSVDLSIAAGLTGDNLISVYPNPTEDEAFISLAHQARQYELAGEKMQIVVSNSIGEIIWRLESVGGETIKLSTAGVPSGVYNVQVIGSAHDALETKRVCSARLVVSR